MRKKLLTLVAACGLALGTSISPALAEPPEEEETATGTAGDSGDSGGEGSGSDSDSDGEEGSDDEGSSGSSGSRGSSRDSEDDDSDDDEDSDSDSSSGTCTIAIDAGHNMEKIEEHDPETGVFMYDYANEGEIRDVWEISENLVDKLEDAGYATVRLRDSLEESKTYRDKVDLAAKENADMAVSIHTTPGKDLSMVIAQDTGTYREGENADGEQTKVTFDNEDTAKKSQEYAEAMATARSDKEPNPVKMVKEWSFDGREAPMWGGNTPILSLLSTDVPWVYNEFGSDNGGGVDPIPDEEKEAYTEGLLAGVEAALPADSCDGDSGSSSDDGDEGSGSGDDADDDSGSSGSSRGSGSSGSSRGGDSGSDSDDDADDESDSGGDEPGPAPAAAASGEPQWLGYYKGLTFLGDHMVDEMLTDDVVEMLEAAGAKEVTVKDTKDAPVDKVAEAAAGAVSGADAVVVALSADAYTGVNGIEEETAAARGIVDFVKEADANRVIWVSPVLMKDTDRDLKKAVKSVNRDVGKSENPTLEFFAAGPIIGESGASNDGALNDAGAESLAKAVISRLEKDAKRAGYEPEYAEAEVGDVPLGGSSSRDEGDEDDDDEDSGSDSSRSSRSDSSSSGSSRSGSSSRSSSSDEDDSDDDEDSGSGSGSGSSDDDSDEDSDEGKGGKGGGSRSTMSGNSDVVTMADWELLAECESGGRWDLSEGSFSGGLQFHPDTWQAYGSDFASEAHLASKKQQVEAANRLLSDQQGDWGSWPACSQKLGPKLTSKKPAPEGTFAKPKKE